ncbi:hypothetical protein SV7mr_49090 [Stieleria bergensis]|uniref:Uncharacterized protein n=1 Tax=Stieleria bergensis TaxID=2528025 RepID=A0A517T1Y8_9BACT|nr:hypothetical protein SV7mr_49090 [Planctomycetes bacterium SV_7m_r]
MTQPVDVTESAFCRFLASVRANRISAGDWEAFTSTPFDGYPAIELARKCLLEAATRLGQSDSCLVPPGLSDVAHELLISLDENYS